MPLLPPLTEYFMTVRPLFDRVLIKRNDEPTRSKGGLFLPETSKEKPSEGTVLAAGEGKLSDEGKLTPLTVKVGDRIVFGKYAGTEIKVDGEDRIILREDDILGILD
jgi:chaperonin GroES